MMTNKNILDLFGSGGPDIGYEIDDSIESNSTLRFLLALSEGTIGGVGGIGGIDIGSATDQDITDDDLNGKILQKKLDLIGNSTYNALSVVAKRQYRIDAARRYRYKNIFVDGTPILSKSGRRLLSGIRYKERLGTSTQTTIDGFNRTSTVYSDGRTITYNAATEDEGWIRFSDNPTSGETIVLGGLTWTFVIPKPATFYIPVVVTSNSPPYKTAIGFTLEDTLKQLVARLNSFTTTNFSLCRYKLVDKNTISITRKLTGTGNPSYTIGLGTAASTRSGASISGGTNTGAGITYTVHTTGIAACNLIFDFGPLMTAAENGDIRGSFVDLSIQVSENGSTGWQDRTLQVRNKILKTDVRVAEKNNGLFQKDIYVRGPTIDGKEDGELVTSTAAWYIRIGRNNKIGTDKSEPKVYNGVKLASVVEYTRTTYEYANTALLALEIDTAKFGNKSPKASFIVDGVKVKVPSNYIDEDWNTGMNGRPTYSGTEWDGRFILRSTSNPVWHIYNMLTNERYGLNIPKSFINVYKLYDLARYCDGYDPFYGYSGTWNARRFTLNTVVSESKDADVLIQEMCSAFRGLSYYDKGTFNLSPDKDRAIEQRIGNEDVESGEFMYANTQASDRVTLAKIAYNNPNDHYKVSYAQYPKVANVPTDLNIKRYGLNEINLTKFGCTSRSEAFSFAKWFVLSSLNETKTVSFTTTAERAQLRPGQLIDVFDSTMMKKINLDPATNVIDVVKTCRYSGRLLVPTVATSSITIDYPVTLNIGDVYTLYIPSETTIDGVAVKSYITKIIDTTTALSTAVLPLTTSLSSVIPAGTAWYILPDSELNKQSSTIATAASTTAFTTADVIKKQSGVMSIAFYRNIEETRTINKSSSGWVSGSQNYTTSITLTSALSAAPLSNVIVKIYKDNGISNDLVKTIKTTTGSTTTVLQLSDLVVFTKGTETYSVVVAYTEKVSRTVDKTATFGVGTTSSSIVLTSALTYTPIVTQKVVFTTSSDPVPETYMIVAIEEKENYTYSVFARQYYGNKYSLVEGSNLGTDPEATTTDISMEDIYQDASAVTNLKLSLVSTANTDDLKTLKDNKLVISWNRPFTIDPSNPSGPEIRNKWIKKYRVKYRYISDIDGSSERTQRLEDSKDLKSEINNLREGTYIVLVAPILNDTRIGPYISEEYTIQKNSLGQYKGTPI